MKKSFIVLLALVLIAALSLVGCQQEAELGTEENPIFWAVVPSGETERVVTGFEDLAQIIFEETGLVVEPFVATEYAGVIEAMDSDPVKAHMSSLATFAYILASEKGVAEAELVALRRGSAFYNGQIYTRADSGINSLADLAGKSFCRPDALSTSGWVIPSLTIRAAGVDPDTEMEVVDAGSHDAAVAGVYNGDCDAGSSFVDARATIEETYPDVMDVIKILEISVEIPNDGVQYHPSVPREIRDQINNVLINIADIEGGPEALFAAYQWDQLALYGDDFYDPFRQILDAAGVDVESLMN
jgi:phosphonate transport system substrate-binding protein